MRAEGGHLRAALEAQEGRVTCPSLLDCLYFPYATFMPPPLSPPEPQSCVADCLLDTFPWMSKGYHTLSIFPPNLPFLQPTPVQLMATSSIQKPECHPWLSQPAPGPPATSRPWSRIT